MRITSLISKIDQVSPEQTHTTDTEITKKVLSGKLRVYRVVVFAIGPARDRWHSFASGKYSVRMYTIYAVVSPIVYPMGLIAQTCSVYFTLVAGADCFAQVRSVALFLHPTLSLQSE